MDIREEVEVIAIEQQHDKIIVHTGAGQITTRKLVITAGHGTNEVLARIEDCAVRFPISPDRPSQCKYFLPPVEQQEQFTAGALPVFAYLESGIYGHPLYPGKTPGVKMGYYNPPDVQVVNTRIHDLASFVETCMPSLRDVPSIDVTDVDQCFYDLVADDNFILGPLPGMPAIAVGVGWRGTGYKFAPWVGRSDAALPPARDCVRYQPVCAGKVPLLEGELHQNLAHPGRKFVAGAAPADADGNSGHARKRAEDEVIVGHQVVETLIDIRHIDRWYVAQGRHTCFDKAGEIVDARVDDLHIWRVVKADFDAWRFPGIQRVAVDSNIEIGKHGQRACRELFLLFYRQQEIFALAGSVRADWEAHSAALDTRQHVVGAMTRRDDQLARGNPALRRYAQ